MSTTLEVNIAQIGPSTSRATARSHTVLVDRPAAKGGEDKGPVGGEYFLVGLGGCFTSHLLAAIRTRDAKVTDVHVTLSGTMDGSPEKFTAINIDVSATVDEPDLLQKLVTISERSCQVTNTLRDAVPLHFAVHQLSATSV
ncbi:MAG: OsmC family protein [Gemmatimonadaceae bacterium]